MKTVTPARGTAVPGGTDMKDLPTENLPVTRVWPFFVRRTLLLAKY